LSRVFGLILAVVLSHSTGCAAYRFGHQSMYRPDIRTVHVPVFHSESLRRNLGERVTEAVIREIEQRTPYKVVISPNADSTLTGRITRESKRVIANNRFDDARDIATELTVEVTWTNRRGELLMQSGVMPLPQLEVEVFAQSQFLPEAGQSLVTAQQVAIERLAREIVNQMEIWW
jgi:riboflavin biosynthesis pyrimidine reductase